MAKRAQKGDQVLIRQGDVLFIKISRLPRGERKKRDNGTVAYGEATGHSHRLAVLDAAEVFEIGDGLYVHVTEKGIGVDGAQFIHEEHDTVTLPTGDWAITIQREYSPEGIRSVDD